jgi:VWFA-related protein
MAWECEAVGVGWRPRPSTVKDLRRSGTAHEAKEKNMTSRLVAILGLLAVTSSPGTGQEDLGAQRFDDTLEISVLNIDVHVTDKRGTPITGLTADDFVLLIDGRPAPLSNFHAVTDGRRQETAPDAPLEAEPLLVTLFLDNYQLRRADRSRVLDDLERFAESVAGEGVRFLVASADPALRLHSPITNDLDDVRIALKEASEANALGDEAVRLWASTISSIRATYETCEAAPLCDPCVDVWGQLISLWDLYGEAVISRQTLAVIGLEELFRAFSGLEGRKALVYTSSELEQRPSIDLLRYLVQLCPNHELEFSARSIRHDHTNQLLDLGARASTSRTTIYALDAAGIRAPIAGSAEFDSHRLRPSGLVDRRKRDSRSGAMHLLAERTGGTAILDNNTPAAELARDAGRDLRNYYSLGYVRTDPPDGENHRIQVDVKDAKRGWQVRSRSAWMDRTLDERLVDRTLASMTLGEQSNPLGVRASIGDMEELESTAIRVPIFIEIEPERMALVNHSPDARAGRFRVFLAAQAPNGDRTVLREKFFDVTPEALEAGLQQIVVNVDLAPGEYTIGVGVRDEIGTETSYLALQTEARIEGSED